jgi:basic amino acid/polyamine antiporter, APA family
MSKSSTNPQGKLVPTIGLVSGILLVVSAVIGSGVFKKIAPMSAELHEPLYVLLAWLIAGVITLFGALSNAEVASMLASAGGEYAYFKIIYNRFFAFLYGWTCFAVIRTASIASIAYVFTQSLNGLISIPNLDSFMPQISIFGLMPFENISVKLIAIALIVFLTFFNSQGLKTGDKLNRILTITLIISVLLIIILGLFSSTGNIQNLVIASDLKPERLTGTALMSGLGVAVLGAFWGYEGWNNLGYIGSELHNPQKNLPRALAIGVLLIMTIYLLLNFVYLYIEPIDSFIAIHESKNGIAAIKVVGSFLGKAGVVAISCLILLTTFNCTSSTILLSSRLFYAMASDKLFFKSASYIHPKHNTPSKALWYQSAWACILVVSGTFDQLTDMLIFASFIFYGATTMGVFILRKRMPDAPRIYKVIGYPIVPAIFLIFCAGLIISTLISRPYEALIGLGLIASGIPFYLYWNNEAEKE